MLSGVGSDDVDVGVAGWGASRVDEDGGRGGVERLEVLDFERSILARGKANPAGGVREVRDGHGRAVEVFGGDGIATSIGINQQFALLGVQCQTDEVDVGDERGFDVARMKSCDSRCQEKAEERGGDGDVEDGFHKQKTNIGHFGYLCNE